MFAPEEELPVSVDDYLELEKHSQVRHEYLDGTLFAMTGASLKHNLIVKNLDRLISAHLGGTGCRSFVIDVKVKVEKLNSFYYPDVIVSCQRTDTDEIFLTNPVLIVEVVSPSTAAIDQREKLMAYKQIRTLKEYVIVHQSTKRVDVYRKESKFTFANRFTTGSFILNSLPIGPLTIEIDEVYKDTSWGYEPPKDPNLNVREIVGELSW